MYKAKYQIWLVILAIALVIGFFTNIFSKIKFEDTITYNLNSSMDSEFIDRFDDYKRKHAKINLTNNEINNDILIEEASDKIINGYTKYSNQFYSEIILYLQVGEYCGTSCELYTEIKDNVNAFYKIIDFKTLLEAVENDKTYADLGLINTSGTHDDQNLNLEMNNKIQLILPGKGLYYYDETINFITYALNGYSYDGIDNEMLLKRVEQIVAKCDTYNSDNELSTRIFNKTLEDNRHIFVGPSYIKDKAIVDSTPNGYYYYVSFLPTKTINIYYDLYVKNREDMTYYDKLFNSLKYSNLFDNTGIKNKEINFDKSYFGLDDFN